MGLAPSEVFDLVTSGYGDPSPGDRLYAPCFVTGLEPKGNPAQASPLWR